MSAKVVDHPGRGSAWDKVSVAMEYWRFSNSLAMNFFCTGSKKNHKHCFRGFLEKVNLSPAKSAPDDAGEMRGRGG